MQDIFNQLFSWDDGEKSWDGMGTIEAWTLHLYPAEFDKQENDEQKTYLFPLNLTVGALKQ